MSLDICLTAVRATTVFDANITHNLARMANAAGFYEHIWRPEEIGITKAEQLIEPLTKCLEVLRSDERRFRIFDDPDGWGRFEHLVELVEKYLAACREYPDAEIGVSR